MKNHKSNGPYEIFIKRFLDIFISLLIIFIFGWVYVIIAIFVRVKLGSSIIFTQDRPGKIDPTTGKEKIFKIYKFRTMNDKRDVNGELLPGKDRLTPFGAKLRAASLDELPEIINILKGDMSIIGPRPLATIYLPYYTEKERIRHLVRPGLTGLAQVHGRNNLTWEEKFSYDIEYVNNVTFFMDIKVIFMTIKSVFAREGIGDGGSPEESFHIYRQKQLGNL